MTMPADTPTHDVRRIAGRLTGWIKRLLGPRPCGHDWRRLAVGWFAYEAYPGKYFVICTKCRARETREETPNG